MISPRGKNWQRVLVLVPVVLVCGAADCGGFGGPLLFPTLPAEVTAGKALTLHLDPAQPRQRFRLPVAVTPTDGGAHADAIVVRATRAFHLNLTTLSGASDNVGEWPIVDVGFNISTFLNGEGAAALAVGLEPGEEQALDIELNLVVGAPADVDFDGVDDGVEVELGALEPLP